MSNSDVKQVKVQIGEGENAFITTATLARFFKVSLTEDFFWQQEEKQLNPFYVKSINHELAVKSINNFIDKNDLPITVDKIEEIKPESIPYGAPILINTITAHRTRFDKKFDGKYDVPVKIIEEL
jgi:hypothetical protein